MSTVLTEYLGMAEDSVKNAHAMAVAQVLPYVSSDPLTVFAGIFLLFWTTRLVLYGKTLSACKDSDYFCGNTFTTFESFARVCLRLIFIFFYSMILANGFGVYGVSPYAFVPVLLTYLIIQLVLWFLYAVKLFRPGDEILTQTNRNNWWQVTKFTVIDVFDHFDLLEAGFYIAPVVVLAFLMK